MKEAKRRVDVKRRERVRNGGDMEGPIIAFEVDG